jgi:tellurite resistance protein
MMPGMTGLLWVRQSRRSETMTPAEKNIVKSLVAVAWADGQMEASETSVVEGLLCGFDASPEEESEIIAYAKTPRTLENDVPLAELSDEDRELLLSNAALITLADGEQTAEENAVLSKLSLLLGFDAARTEELLSSAEDGALVLGSRPLRAL